MQDSLTGFFAIFLWCIISALAYVFTGYIETGLNPIVFCFGIFFFTTICFLMFNFKNRYITFKKVKRSWKDILIVNITTFGCWYLNIYPLKFIEPAIVIAVILASLPVATLIASKIFFKNKKINMLDCIVSILLFFGILYLAIILFQGKSGMKFSFSSHVMLPFLFCIAAGCFLAVNNIFVKKLVSNGLTSLDVLATRFLMITIIMGCMSYHLMYQVLHLKVILDIAIIATSLIIIPQILYQYALKELEVITVALIAPIMPILVFFIEFLSSKLHPTFWTILGVFYLSLISALGVASRYVGRESVLPNKQ